MAYKKALFLGMFLSTSLYAGDLVKPGSIYCDAVIALETKEYNVKTGPLQKNLPVIRADLAYFMNMPTPAERAIMEVEKSSSPRLAELNNRILKEIRNYKNEFSTRPEEEELFIDYKYDKLTDSNVLIYQFQNKKDGSFFYTKIPFSTLEKEKAHLESQIENETPSLKKHLAKKVNKKCFKKGDLARINGDDRVSGKEISEESIDEEKKDPASGAIKN